MTMTTEPLAQPDAELRFACWLALNAMRRAGRGAGFARGLVEWAQGMAASTGDSHRRPVPLPMMRHHRGTPPTQRAWAAAEERLLTLADPAPFAMLGTLAEEFGLSPEEAATLATVAHYGQGGAVESLMDLLGNLRTSPRRFPMDAEMLSLLVGVAPAQMAAMLRPDAPLRACGLLVQQERGLLRAMEKLLHPRDLLHEALPEGITLRGHLLGTARPARLGMEDFAHLGEDAPRLLALLRGALAAGAAGVHVLLHGPPGTGKSELCRTLAAALDRFDT